MRLANPDRMIDWIARRTRWMTSAPAGIGWVLLIIAAMIQVFVHSDQWSAALAPLVDPAQWWTIGLAAIALRVLHELAHGVVANRFGVRVTEFGILWILLVPLPYVDVSGCWQRNRRAERILVAAAGMLAELVVAAIAVGVFAVSRTETTQHIAATVAVTASAVTLLFNANILMRFDGYHILVDALGYPNLYSDAIAFWRDFFSRMLLGKRTSRVTLPRGVLGMFLRLYGLGAAIWRLVIVVGLVLAAEHLFGGVGVLIALAAVVALVVQAIRGVPKMLVGVRPIRALLGITAVACILGAIWQAPLSWGQRELGVARHREPVQVRNLTEGFVREVLVSRGQHVRSGDPLIVLQNSQLEHDLTILRIELSASELRYRQFLADNEMASAAAQWSTLEQLRKQLQQRQQQHDQLTVRATTEGMVAAPDSLSLWLGRYLGEGTELMQLVRRDDLEVVVLVTQRDRDSWARRVGKSLSIRRPIDWESGTATLMEVSPRATDVLPHASLGAHLGGSLPVRAAAMVDGEHDATDDHDVRLLQPRFEAHLDVAGDTPLRDGQRVLVTMPSVSTTVADVVSESTSRWLQTRIARHSLLRQWINF